MGQEITPEQQLDKILHTLLEQAGIPPADRGLICAVAKEMIGQHLKNELGKDISEISPHHLLKDKIPGFRDFLKETLSAATGVSMLLVHREEQKLKLSDLLLQYDKLQKQDPEKKNDAIQKELAELREEIRDIMKFFNKLEPDPAIAKHINDMLAKDENIDLIAKSVARKTELDQKRKTQPLTPEEEKEDKLLEETLQNLFGVSRVPGKICGPVQCIVGDPMGIPDYAPAMGFEPIHLLSGDFDREGRDEHAEVSSNALDSGFLDEQVEIRTQSAIDLSDAEPEASQKESFDILGLEKHIENAFEKFDNGDLELSVSNAPKLEFKDRA